VRINVYSQELTEEVELIEKKSNTGVVYYGVRMYLASPDVLHHTPDDDDRSAVTFWLPTAQHFNTPHLASVFRRLADLTDGVVQ
jgi:hypothetical protein